MMIVQVHMQMFGTDGRVVRFEHVADVVVSAHSWANKAWDKTQNIDEPWILDPAVTVTAVGNEFRKRNWRNLRKRGETVDFSEVGIRSTMVGDIFISVDTKLRIETIGFKRVG